MTDHKNKYILSPSELATLVGKSQAAISKALKEKKTIPLNGRRVGIPNKIVHEYLTKAGADFSFRVIAHLNLRGGCSKTSSTINMASRAYQYGHKVCILDLDSQASASLAFNTIPKDDDSIFLNLWNSPENIEKSLVKIEDGFSILPSSLDNGLLDSTLSKPQDQKLAVANVCKKLKELGYTLIVIDCSPSLGAAVVSSIAAADTIVIPVSGDIFSVKGLRLTLDEIKSVSSAFGLELPEIKILFSFYDGRQKLHIETLSDLAKDPEFSNMLLPCFIRTSAEIPKAAKNRETIFATLKKSSAREDFDMYSREVLGFNNLNNNGAQLQ